VLPYLSSERKSKIEKKKGGAAMTDQKKNQKKKGRGRRARLVKEKGK